MMRYFLFLTGLLLINIAKGADDTTDVVESPSFTPDQIEFFESQIRPVLVEHCYDCHSTDAAELKAGLYVDSRDGMLKGGESGAAVIVGKPADSLLLSAVRYESNEMPPDRKLEPRQIEVLAKWIEMGAPWPQVTSSPGVALATGNDWSAFDWEAAQQSHWAWQPVHRPAVPVVNNATVNNPIDNFIVARRAEAELQAAPKATPPILARRIYNDLIGIPPTPQQVASFVNVASVDPQRAVNELVDELLRSTMYGQRWARHWLDVARYSDGEGGFLDKKALDEAWRYRDWVVNALNSDLPINEFIRLQIAGDLSGNAADAIATGFFANGPTYQSDGGDPESIAQSKSETLDDRIDVLTRGLLGVTGSCARCHDHKFDPIPQQDYYSLAGIFNNSDVHDLPLAPKEVVKRFNDHQHAVDELNKKIKNFEKSRKKKENPEVTSEDQAELDEWKAMLTELEKDAPPKYPAAHALRESGSDDMKVALRGNLLKTGNVAPRRFLRLLSATEPVHYTKGSGREELATAIIDPKNPLTARVFVNRIWMHHFGAGIVRTPSNFGSLGELPTHPELLDWLASEFVAKGWSLKSLHRLIMTSSTYQLSSEFNEPSFRADGDNRFLWRMSPRRMDVESWRDSLLAVTGELDLSLGGPSSPDVTENKRRTLYAKVSRNGDVFASDAFLRRFDFPLMRATVEQRPSSIVPQQFLFLMNSRFMIDRAKSLTARLYSKSDSDEDRIRQAYQWLYSRHPDPTELAIGLKFVNTVSDGSQFSNWDRYAQVLLSSNEFMFVR